jgi:hypothetical protein
VGWPDRQRAAISFSFDDARPSQLHRGLPLLDRLGVRATFFVLPAAVARADSGWRHAAARGHEVGNHTMTHPCSANFAWSRTNAVEQMTLADYRSEVCEANRHLRELLGIDPTVFAYPCGNTFVGQGRDTQSLVPLIAELFDVGRTFNDVVANSPVHLDPAQTACVNSDGRSFATLLPSLEAALADGAWLVLGGHEIGATGEPETTGVETIEAVVSWCRSHRVWIDTIGTVASAVATFNAPGERVKPGH